MRFMDVWLYWKAVVAEAFRIVLSGFGYGRPVQFLTPILVATIGFVAFSTEGRSSQEVFDFADSLIAGAKAMAITAGLIFLSALIIVPARRSRRQERIIERLQNRIQELERAQPQLALAISCDEIVVGGVGIIRATGAPPGPTWPGTYFVASGFQVTNRGHHRVVLAVRLRVKVGDIWRDARIRSLDHPASPLDPRAFDAHDNFLLALSEQPLGHPINLGPTEGASGRLTFYLDLDTAEHIEDLRTGDMTWEIHDSVSDLRQTYPAARTRDQWRVLLSRFDTRAARNEPPPWLKVEPGELVIVPAEQASMGVLLGGVNIESGTYVIVQNTRLTNLSPSPVALVPTLVRRLDGRESRYPSRGLPETLSSNAPLAYGSIIRYLGGVFAPVINLGPTQGDARRLVFRALHRNL